MRTTLDHGLGCSLVAHCPMEGLRTTRMHPVIYSASIESLLQAQKEKKNPLADVGPFSQSCYVLFV